MSVTSRLLPWEVTGVNARNHSSFPGGEAVFQVYNAALGLDAVHYGEDMKAAGLRRRLKPRLKPRLTPYPLATPADRPPVHVCLCREPGLHLAGQHEQRHVLPRPAPQVRPVHLQLYVARAGPGPLWPRRDPRGEFFTHSNHCLVPLHVHYTTSITLPLRRARTRAGVGGSRSRSRPRATAWCPSSSRSTRRWSTPSALRAASPTSTTAAASLPLLVADSAFPLSPGFIAFALLLARLGRTRRGSAARRLGSQLGWCVCACWVWALAHSVGVTG